MPNSDERLYKGKHPCLVTSALSPMKTVRVQWLDNTFRKLGTFDIVPVRMCHRRK